MIEEWKLKEIINPVNLFNSNIEVEDFLNIPCTLEDLQCFLDVCIEEELYNFCTLITNKINEKAN